MGESRLRTEKKSRQRAAFAKMSPSARLRLGAGLSAVGQALLVREKAAPHADGPPEPFKTLATVLAILRRSRTPHALIGGWAVNAWGVARATADVDILADYPRPPRRLLAALDEDLAAEWKPGDVDDPIDGLIRASSRQSPWLQIDLLRAVKTADLRALERATQVDLEGLEIPLVRPEDLLAMKLQAGGGLDWQDAQAVYGVQRGKIDEALIEQACRERRVLDRLARLRRR